MQHTDQRGASEVVLDREGERDDRFLLIPGEVALPASTEKVVELLSEGSSCLPFGPCAFVGVTSGRHTLVRWSETPEKTLVETQPVDVSGKRVEVKWAPVASKAYLVETKHP